MKFITRFISNSLFIFCFFINHGSIHSMEQGYTIEELQNHVDKLRSIATLIASKKENIDFIKSELFKKHSKHAFDLWSKYNDNSMPTVSELKQMNLSYDITRGKKIDSNFRKNDLRPLVGKTTMTVYSDETINDIKKYIEQAIIDGSITLTFNKMLVEKYKSEGKEPPNDMIQINFQLKEPIGIVFTKEAEMPPKVSPSQPKSNMTILLYAGGFIESLLNNKHAELNNTLDGTIKSVS